MCAASFSDGKDFGVSTDVQFFFARVTIKVVLSPCFFRCKVVTCVIGNLAEELSFQSPVAQYRMCVILYLINFSEYKRIK